MRYAVLVADEADLFFGGKRVVHRVIVSEDGHTWRHLLTTSDKNSRLIVDALNAAAAEEAVAQLNQALEEGLE